MASQIRDSFQTYGRETSLRYTVIFGGVGQHPQVKALRNGVDVVVATPGRLLDLMNQGHVDLRAVEIFVLDEADRMLDMGFLPDLRRVIAKLPSVRQTVFFSATMPAPIEQLADSILRDPVRIRVAVKETTDLIEQSVCFVEKKQKPQLLTTMLRDEKVTRAVVFTRTKHGADRVTRHLNHAGVRAEAIHGNKSQSARQQSLAKFKSNRPPVLVATDLARGASTSTPCRTSSTTNCRTKPKHMCIASAGPDEREPRASPYRSAITKSGRTCEASSGCCAARWWSTKKTHR